MPIDILIGNAAAFGGTRSHFPDLDWAAWRRVLEVNVIGTIRVAVRLWRNVAASTERKIVFVSSRAGLPREATPGRSYLYGSSKAALNSAARCLALDLAPEGVIAALVNPGHVQTGIGGANAPMTATESVTKMRAVIADLTAADAGKFLHYDGTELKLVATRPRRSPSHVRRPRRACRRRGYRRAPVGGTARGPVREVDAEHLLEAGDVVAEVVPELDPVLDRQRAPATGTTALVAEHDTRELVGHEVGSAPTWRSAASYGRTGSTATSSCNNTRS